jgi:GNAT superfamily N-acetyltransferase
LSAPYPSPETQPLTSADAASGFVCESPELTRFFGEQATQNQRRDMSHTWVLHRPDERPELPRVLGFYTLTLGAIEREALPPELARRLPRYPIPALLIGRLARDSRVRGLGIGEQLLADAHLRVLAVNAQAGGVVVLVDAKDPRAHDFYARFGYVPLGQTGAAPRPDWPRRMFLPVATLRKAFESGS